MTPYYEDGSCVIYHGDCREVLPALRFDVVVTDPPYGIAWRRGSHPARLSRSHAGIVNDDDTSARDDALALIGACPALVFGSFYAPPPHEVRQVLVWHKGDTQGPIPRGRPDHPPGVVCDPFMGSGTTLRAAKDLGRTAIGIEVDERYCEVAAKRLAQEVLDFGGVA